METPVKYNDPSWVTIDGTNDVHASILSFSSPIYLRIESKNG